MYVVRTRVRLSRRALARLALAQPGADAPEDQAGGEARSVDEVAAEQPARLLEQPVQPLEAGALHPHRRAADVAGQEAERHADVEEARLGEEFDQLLGRARADLEGQADGHQVGLVLPHGGDHGRELARVVEEAARRAVGADDVEPRDRRGELLGEAVGHRRLTPAEQEQRQPLDGSPAGHGLEDRRAGHALGQGAPGDAGRPDDRRAVGEHEVGLLDVAARLRALVRLAHELEVRGDDERALLGLRELDHALDRATLGDRVELDAVDVEPAHAPTSAGRSAEICRTPRPSPVAGSRISDVAADRERTPSLVKADDRWFLTVLSVITSLVAISALEQPSTTRARICFSRLDSGGRSSACRDGAGGTGWAAGTASSGTPRAASAPPRGPTPRAGRGRPRGGGGGRSPPAV